MLRSSMLVVGAGPGLGYAVGARFCRAGFHVGLVTKEEAMAEDLRARAHDDGWSPSVAVANTNDERALSEALHRFEQEHGSPSVLVYNASSSHEAWPSALSTDTLLTDLRSNLLAAIQCVQHVLPAMRRAGRGTILLSGGGQALQPTPQLASLAIGKAALRNYALALHEELAPLGIHAATITICGFIRPDSPFAPAQLAPHYLRLHEQAPSEFEREVVLR